MRQRYLPDALPARFTLNPAAMEALKIKTLDFPFLNEVEKFRHEVEDALNASTDTEGKEYNPPPLRQFNNALLYCAPTLTNGFEFYKNDERVIEGKKVNLRHSRTLAVGTTNSPIHPVTCAQMHDLIRIWIGEWAREYEGRNASTAEAAERFRQNTAYTPKGWDWQDVSATKLFNDSTAENGLGYTAIPSSLATLLHERTCTITRQSEDGVKASQVIRWRKAQGLYGNDKTGLFVVSQPIRGSYYNDQDELVEGYFAYRLDFRIETQTGRFNSLGKLEPLVFLYLSCQRYGDAGKLKPVYGRKISFLVGSSKPNKDGFPVDGTLVRLTAYRLPGEDEQYGWYHHLPSYIENLDAERLPDVNAIINNPTAFANWDDDPNWQGITCRLVHVEGARYLDDATGTDGKGIDHVIEPGYSLRERADIMAEVLRLLDGILIPDSSFEQDIPRQNGLKSPKALRTHDWYMSRLKTVKDVEQARLFAKRQMYCGIHAATGGLPIHLALFHQKTVSKEANEFFLRKALFVGDEEPLPDWLNITYHLTSDKHTALLPDVKEPERTAFTSLKHSAWREIVGTAFAESASPVRLAFAEIAPFKLKTVHPRRNMKGLARGAFAYYGVSSQFLVSAACSKSSAQPEEDGVTQENPFTRETEYRFLNGIRDLLLRQTGALLGSPIEIYQAAGVPEAIAQKLDIIAFCRRRVLRRPGHKGDIQYTIAVRLRANGAVEVMLPDSKLEWIPYVQAGPKIGKIFWDARNTRKEDWRNGKRLCGPVKLRGPQLAEFVERVLFTVGDQPTVAVIEARGWRNGGGEETEGAVWPQLRNPDLHSQKDILSLCRNVYNRDDTRLQGLLAIVRLRSGAEAPQYVTNRTTWDEQTEARDFSELCGFIDRSSKEILHYFSVGALSEAAAAEQRDKIGRELYKTETITNHRPSRRGAIDDFRAPKIAYKHPQMVEMVPFFVRDDFKGEGETWLCRALHYLRISPGFAMGNIDSPFPLHLGDCLIDDQVCILDVND